MNLSLADVTRRPTAGGLISTEELAPFFCGLVKVARPADRERVARAYGNNLVRDWSLTRLTTVDAERRRRQFSKASPWRRRVATPIDPRLPVFCFIKA